MHFRTTKTTSNWVPPRRPERYQSSLYHIEAVANDQSLRLEHLARVRARVGIISILGMQHAWAGLSVADAFFGERAAVCFRIVHLRSY